MKTKKEQIIILKKQIEFYSFYTSYGPIIGSSVRRCQTLLDKLQKG